MLFSSIHCYLDPSSGAALCTRELLELQAGRGMDCRVLMTGISVPEPEMSLDEVLTTLELTTRRFQAQVGTGGGGRRDRSERQRHACDLFHRNHFGRTGEKRTAIFARIQ